MPHGIRGSASGTLLTDGILLLEQVIAEVHVHVATIHSSISRLYSASLWIRLDLYLDLDPSRTVHSLVLLI